MDASYLENKILNLQARLKAEKEPSQREHFIRSMPPNVLSSPVSSSGRRPKQCKYYCSVRIILKEK